MLKREQDQNKTNVRSKMLKKERSVDKAKTEILNKIIEQIRDIIKTSKKMKTSTEGFRHHQRNI